MSINSIGVVGTGQMGSGIAQTAITSGLKTYIWDLKPEATERAIKGISDQLSKMVEKEKISAADKDKALSLLAPISKITEFNSCDLIVEAATENLELKLKLFADLDSSVKKEAILASNTSSISITKIASSTNRADLVIGMHFMNPVPIMKLVELIKGMQTSETTYNSVKAVAEKMGKTTVLGIDSPGFIVNRVLVPMINEAFFLLQEGVKADDIDQAMKLGTNVPMGPLTLADFVGLDTCLYILHVLHKELGEDKYRPCPLLTKYVEAGWFGKKTGRGVYDYRIK